MSVIRYDSLKKKSQSEFSEEIGFNRRLLSKYELGTSNISYSTFIYLFECYGIDNQAAHNIFEYVISMLARRKVFVYLNLENVSLNNSEEETLQKKYVKNSYVYIYNWFGFRYKFDEITYENFCDLKILQYKEIDHHIKNIMKTGRLDQIGLKYRKQLKKQRIDALENNLKDLEKEIISIIKNNGGNYQSNKIDDLLKEMGSLEKEIEKVMSKDEENFDIETIYLSEGEDEDYNY
ncbi:hypothetical protein GS19_05660 [Acinetobacter idrijaensis]|nr:hypothetical protein GS19_05660 [Acinetobacter idrijaensis]